VKNIEAAIGKHNGLALFPVLSNPARQFLYSQYFVSSIHPAGIHPLNVQLTGLPKKITPGAGGLFPWPRREWPPTIHPGAPWPCRVS